jgi:DNA-directed RNA polymerase specialized sigma subunit
MSEQNREPTPQEIAEMQAQSRQQYQHRIEAISGHVIGMLAATGASAHAISMIGSYLVGAGIDQLAKEDRAIAERVSRDLAAGFVQVINNLGLQPEPAETEQAD